MSNRGGGSRHLVAVPAAVCVAWTRLDRGATGRRFIAFDLPAVEGTRSSVVGDGGCRVVRAGWSSYPTGVLRARTYSSGHVVLVLVRRSSTAVDLFFIFKFKLQTFTECATTLYGSSLFYTVVVTLSVFIFVYLILITAIRSRSLLLWSTDARRRWKRHGKRPAWTSATPLLVGFIRSWVC